MRLDTFLMIQAKRDPASPTIWPLCWDRQGVLSLGRWVRFLQGLPNWSWLWISARRCER